MFGRDNGYRVLPVSENSVAEGRFLLVSLVCEGGHTRGNSSCFKLRVRAADSRERARGFVHATRLLAFVSDHVFMEGRYSFHKVSCGDKQIFLWQTRMMC